MACQRFYEKSYDPDTAPATATTQGQFSMVANGSLNRPLGTYFYKATKRSAPTITYYSPNTGTAGNCYDLNAAADRAASAFGNTAGLNCLGIFCNATPAANNEVDFHLTVESDL